MVIKKALLTCALLATPLYAVSVQDSLSVNRMHAVRILPSGENKCDFTSYKPARLSHFTKLATLSRAFPVYPKEAAQRQIQGLVNVKILVNRTGNVVEACSVDGHPVLQEAARSAALQWKFKANYGFGKPKRGRKEVIPNECVEDVLLFNFTLDKGGPNVSSAPKRAEISARARLNSENDPNKLISSGTSEPRHLQAKDWRKVNLKHFSFSLPKAMAPLRVRGTDSALWKYASSTLELTIDLGIYSEKPLDLSEDPQSREEQTRIDGKRATIVFARNDAADSLTYPYLAAAYFSNIGLHEVKLSFFATCATLEQQEIARKIFLSIDFRQSLVKQTRRTHSARLHLRQKDRINDRPSLVRR